MPLTAEQMKQIASRMYAEANEGNLEIFDELLTPDFVSYGGAGFQDLYGRDAFKDLYTSYVAAFPDLDFLVDDLIAENNLCFARGTLSGTHEGEFMGMGPPTGRRATWTGIAILSFNEDGKIDARWQEFDAVSLLQQLGVMPANGEPGPKPPAPDPPRNPGPTTSPQDARAVMVRLIDDVWNEGNLDAVDEIFHPEATSPSAPDLPPGPEGVKAIAEMFLTSFEGFHMSIDKIAAEPDKVGARFVQTGTLVKEFMGVQPTGKEATWTEIAILRLEGGMVVQSWYETDMLSLMQQLGVGGATPAASA